MKRLLTFMILVLMLCGCGSRKDLPSAPAAQPDSYYGETTESPTVLVLSMSGSNASLNGQWAALFRDLVAERSGGKLQIRIFGEGALGTDLETFASCRYGTIDLQIVSAASVQSVFPEVGIFDVPFLFEDLETVRTRLKDPVLREYLDLSCDRSGTVMLAVTDHGFRNLSLRIPLTSSYDFQHLTLRCLANENHNAFWQAIGFRTVNMDISDVYLALQKGGVQAEENTYDQIYTNRLYELQKYMTNSQHLPDVKLLLGSRITWDSLSPSDQEILKSAAEESTDAMTKNVDTANQQALSAMLREGCRLIDIDSIPGLREYCRDAGQRAVMGLPGFSEIPETVLNAWTGGTVTP